MASVTVFETFFMMVAVIPMSKMLSTIFMKMAVRAGTVDQDKWAVIGLGAIGGVMMFMRRGVTGNMFGNNTRNINRDPGSSGDGNTGNLPPMIGGISRGYQQPGGGTSGGRAQQSSYSGPMPGTVPPIGSTASNQGEQGRVRFSAQQGPGGSVRYSARQVNQPLDPNSGAGTTPGSGPAPGTVPPIGSNTGEIGSSGGTSHYSDTGQTHKNNEPPSKGQRTLQDIAALSSEKSNKFARGSAMVGGASSFAVPEIMPVMAGMFGATGKATAGYATSGYYISSEIKERMKNGQNFSGALKDMTGCQNTVKATMKVSSAFLMSPMNFGARNTGRSYQWAKDRTN